MAGGRPSGYRPELCEMLINHMRGGNSIESFGAVAQCCKQTIYNWLEAHPEFLDAKKIGEALLAKFYEDLGKRIATGTLTRVKSERPHVDANGELMYDKEGKVVMVREYEQATPGQASWIFLCKNMLGWRDKRDINHAGQPDNPTPIQIVPVRKSKAELEKRFKELQSLAVHEASIEDDGF